jgi:multicomponent Na+:H+ antiporter subunit E
MQGWRGTIIKRFGAHTLWCAGLWVALTQADLRSPGLALLGILAGAAVATKTGLGSGWRIRPSGVPGFVALFLRASFAGGVDVGARAFRRRRALDPALLRHTLKLAPDSPGRPLFTAVASLIPGTLCAGTDGPTVTIHVIDQRQDWRALLERLEQRVADLVQPAPAAPEAKTKTKEAPRC